MGLDLFDLLVNNIFGNIFLSGLGMSALFVFAGIIGRMSATSIIIINAVFLSAFMSGYIGALAAFPLFVFAFIYFISGIINYFNQTR